MEDGGRWGRGRSDDCSGEGVRRVSGDFSHPMRRLEREGHTRKLVHFTFQGVL